MSRCRPGRKRSFVRSWVFFAPLALATACGGNNATATESEQPAAESGFGFAQDGPRLDAVQTVTIHNSYSKDEPIFDQLLFHNRRSVELDLHNGSARSWDVYHVDVIDDWTSCDTLRDCLRLLKSFHDAVPEHELVTVFLDVQDDFDDDHSGDTLDRTLRETLGDLLFSPPDLLASCPGATSLRDASHGTCRWPLLSSLRGKFLFTMTGSTACKDGGLLRSYAAPSASDRAVFLTPDIGGSCPASAYESVDDIVMLNITDEDFDIAPELSKKGYLTRAYGTKLLGAQGFDSPGSFAEARDALVTFIATDDANRDADPFTRLESERGWPFVCKLGKSCPTDLTERRNVVVARVVSGDLWGKNDSGMFRYTDTSGSAGTREWSSAISVASSHVTSWGKGCLMARAGTAADDAYAAVCRPADAHRARLQVRKEKGASTDAFEFELGDGLSDESAFWIKLQIFQENIVVASASVDGATWVTKSARFTAPLPLQGIATSSHGSSEVKFVFSQLAGGSLGASAPVAASDLGGEVAWNGARGSLGSDL